MWIRELRRLAPDDAFQGDGSGLTSVPGGSSLWSSGAVGRIYYNSGNVGIGTATPIEELHVKNATGEAVIEIESDTVHTWNNIPEYAGALDKAIGADRVNELDAACAARMETFNDMAERLYINWLQATART